MIQSILAWICMTLSRVNPAIGSSSYLMGVLGYLCVNSNMRLIWYYEVLPLYGLQRTLNLYGAVSLMTWNQSRQIHSKAVNQSRCYLKHYTYIYHTNQIYIIMAFVSQNSRQLTQTIHHYQPAPNTYHLTSQKTIETSFAPFASTTSRVNRKQIIGPGPGEYQVAKNIGEPTITTYANKQSIVIRVNSQGTAPFISKIPRFQPETTPPPGPGYYQLQAQHKDKSKRKHPTKKRIIQPIRNAPSIVDKTKYLNRKRARTQETIRNIKNQIREENKTQASVWARNKVQRFETVPANPVGPGKYLLQSKKIPKSHSLSVGFASKTVRSHFDTLIYQAHNNKTLEARLLNGYKNQIPGPGSYNTTEPSLDQSAKYKNQSFGTNQERFQQAIHEERNYRPFYDVSDKKEIGKGYPQFRSQVKRSLTMPSEDEKPGPGFYDPDLKRIGKVLKVQIGQFGSKSKRPGLLARDTYVIGPGSYDPSPCKIEEEVMPASYFSSSVPRFIPPAQDVRFGSYEVFHDDMSRKANLNRIHRENLQKIDCFKPAFDTQKPRFSHYENFQKVQKVQPKRRELMMMQAKERQRDRAIEDARSQIPAKRSTISQSKRFIEPKRGPGVGQYPVRSQWFKKSFNLKFKEKDDKNDLSN